MDIAEAAALLSAQLSLWRRRSYAELRHAVGRSHRFEVTGESGTEYQGSVDILWDGKPEGAIRVVAAIDDGGWRAWMPISDDFIRAPDGTLIGE